MTTLPELLTLKDVAGMLRCSKSHVCKIVNGQVAGTPPIPALALGRRKLVRRESLLRWIAASERNAAMGLSLEIDAGRRA